MRTRTVLLRWSISPPSCLSFCFLSRTSPAEETDATVLMFSMVRFGLNAFRCNAVWPSTVLTVSFFLVATGWCSQLGQGMPIWVARYNFPQFPQ